MRNLPAIEMFKTVFKYLFGKTACKMYPGRPATVFESSRGHIEFDGADCILCALCAKNCPTEAITVERDAHFWQINRLRCILCGSCVEKCPKKCITMIGAYAPPATRRLVEKFDVPLKTKAEKSNFNGK